MEPRTRWRCWVCKGTGEISKHVTNGFFKRVFLRKPRYETLDSKVPCRTCSGSGILMLTQEEVWAKETAAAQRDLLSGLNLIRGHRSLKMIPIDPPIHPRYSPPPESKAKCRNCSFQAWASTLPRKVSYHDDQVTTTYCPNCGSENIF